MPALRDSIDRQSHTQSQDPSALTPGKVHMGGPHLPPLVEYGCPGGQSCSSVGPPDFPSIPTPQPSHIVFASVQAHVMVHAHGLSWYTIVVQAHCVQGLQVSGLHDWILRGSLWRWDSFRSTASHVALTLPYTANIWACRYSWMLAPKQVAPAKRRSGTCATGYRIAPTHPTAWLGTTYLEGSVADPGS